MGNRVYLPEGALIGEPENRIFLASKSGLDEARRTGMILEAMAVCCDENFRLTVDLGCMRGYMERDDVALSACGEPVRDIAVITRVGKAVCFKVMGFTVEKGHTVAVLSRREAQRECRDNYLSGLIPGDIIDAKITHNETFGSFVDIGCGLISLLSIDCISVSRISHPSDRFSVGDRIRVIIKNVDHETGRIFVTHKELLGTWEENAGLFSVGQTVAGIVRSIEPYGVFVELTPNLAGLAEYRPDMVVGQTAAVYIKNLIPDRMKVKLVLIDSYRGEKLPPCVKCGIGDEIAHIDHWRYSPRGCHRTIETDFCDEERSGQSVFWQPVGQV